MIALYTERPTQVRALQLTPETADELCRWTLGYRLGEDRWVQQEGCWRVSALRFYRPIDADRLHRIGALIVGLRTRGGMTCGLREEVAVSGDWVVQAGGTGGGFQIFTADRFNDLYTEVQS